MQLDLNEATTMKRSDLPTDVIFASQYGFDGLEIRLDKLQDYLSNHTVRDLKSMLDQARLTPLSFNAS